MNFRRPPRFTLIELVVVLTVIALSTALGVSALRGESDSRTLESFSLNLEAYFARVRYRATEEGCTWDVYLDAETRTFSACRRMTAAENESRTLNAEDPPPVLKWNYPEKITLTGVENRGEPTVETIEKKVSIVEQRRQDEEMANADYVPVGERMFCFYADGFTGGTHLLEIECGALTRKYEVSTLTGRLIEVKEEFPR